ncbi:MAG: aconitase X catalytic domain-containing protein [Bauldia sp.]|nr:aconitase X catalytic domain-containing protein [Bauldia sp.]
MIALDDIDRALLRGDHGPAAVFAMELLVAYGSALGAPHFIPVVGAHVDGCLYHGAAGLDFVRRLVELGGRVRLPTTLNVGTMDLIHPELYRGDPAVGRAGRELMELHGALGCLPTFTCAPYQTMFRPRFGDQIAWGESNAIVFANSVIGARTARYGDFTDLAAAMTGRVPFAGLHVPGNRCGEVLFVLPDDAANHWEVDALAVAVGYLIGIRSGSAVPVIVGLPGDIGEDALKALGAVAASAGATGLFHAVGITPDAPDVATAFAGVRPAATIDVGHADIADALRRLSTVEEGTPIAAVALGTPHFSRAEFTRLMPLLDGFVPAPGVEIYVNTARDTLRAVEAELADEWFVRRASARLTVVTDTCTYVSCLMPRRTGAVMTNSGKWAHYAPGNLGVEVAFGSLAECIASAASGRVTRLRR